MKSHLVSTVLGILTSMAAVDAAHAALVINNGDISGGSYTYNLDYADMATSATFNSDVATHTNLVINDEGAGNPRYLIPDPSNNGATSASLTFAFDFTTTDYRPNSVSVQDSFFAIYNDPDNHPRETLTSSWSTDGLNWNTIRSVNTDSAPLGTFIYSFGSPDIIDLSSLPDTFYYKVEMTADEKSFGYGWTGAEWNRVDPGHPEAAFETVFSVSPVPEPSSSLLAALPVIGLGLFRGRLRRR